jgi:hypothetical protein
LNPCANLVRAADVASGILWAVAYVLIIRRGFLDKTYGMPLPGLALAITWEFIFAVLRPTPELPSFIVPAWLVIDSCILYQYLRYSPAEQQPAQPFTAAWFYARSAAALAGAFWLQYSFILDAADRDGAVSGFAVNLVISLAFIAMLERRRDVRGQSMYIALAKLVGSAVLIPHAYLLHGSLRSLRALMVTTFICDVVYAVLLHRQCRVQGIHPWARL